MSSSVLGLSSEQLAAVLQATVRAPSLHNSQPWAFRLTPDRIELHLDRTRSLSAADPEDREARLACGAALFNLRLALARQGVLADVRIRPHGDAGPLAVVGHGGSTVLSPERAELERAIPHRRTNRRPFFDAEVPDSHQWVLARAVEAEGATLQTITDPARLAHLRQWVADAQRQQAADPAWAAEWARWTGRRDTLDGVPLTAAGPAPAPRDEWTLRDFGSRQEDAASRPDRPDGKNFEEQPLLAVLASYTDTPHAQIHAGQALQRVLLAATQLGLAVSFLSQLVEVPAIRRQVGSILAGSLHPQAVLRIGFGGPVPQTPRRSVEDCLLAEAASSPLAPAQPISSSQLTTLTTVEDS